MPSEEYKDFIKEAFIEPIRSVLIVDDDYPTFDEVLASQIKANHQGRAPEMNPEKDWYRDPISIQGVLNRFRASHQPLLVDIHDGSNVNIGEEYKAAGHLHQSDLLVLDYQLDRHLQGDGTKAIDIARALGRSSHFNLVLVHTSEDLDRVFREMLIGMMPPFSNLINDDDNAAIGEKLFDLVDDYAKLESELLQLATEEHYLHLRHSSDWPGSERPDGPSKAGFDEITAKLGIVEPREKDLVYRWAIKQREKALSPRLNDEGSLNLSWSEEYPKWMRTDSVFIAFSNKGRNDDLLEELLQALTAWRPRPSRLFLAALRKELEDKGVLAESKALGNNHVLAHWYKRLLESSGSEREVLVGESVTRHSEQLLNFVLPTVVNFATRLVRSESDDANGLCRQYFNVDLNDNREAAKSQIEHNAFVCSKKVEGYHLTTGHILRIGDDLFVCLSPSCDLVPGRKSEVRYGDIGDTLPFTAVRLQSFEGDKLPKRVQSNRFVFLKIDETVKIFGLNDPTNEAASPHSFTFYASNEGRFLPNEKKLRVQRIVSDNIGGLKSQLFDAEVISQLRYEYALNLLQKLGSVSGRVGLDFVGK